MSNAGSETMKEGGKAEAEPRSENRVLYGSRLLFLIGWIQESYEESGGKRHLLMWHI